MPTPLCKPVNVCIYCGTAPTADDPLSDEHIFPEGIGADLTVPVASCRACAAETSLVERHVLRDYFGATRAELQAYGKRRRDQRPTTLPVVNVADGSVDQIDIADYPFSFIRLELDPAGILVDRERYSQGPVTTEFRMFVMTTPQALRRIETFNRTGPERAVQQTVTISDFYRILAKSAHAFTVAVIGYGAFTPALADYIRTPGGEINEGSYFIGGAYHFGRSVEGIGSGMYMHQATLLRGYARARHWLVVRVQFFAPLGAVYDVFTGWLPDDPSRSS